MRGIYITLNQKKKNYRKGKVSVVKKRIGGYNKEEKQIPAPNET